jgi:hypothetical protein
MTESVAPALACPYPGCQGTAVPTEGRPEELAVCGTCHRLAARCPRTGAQGRCPTLNRALARFCRRCRQELEPSWAQQAWAGDAGGRSPRRGAAAVVRVQPALEHAGGGQPVYCLEDHLAHESWDGRALALQEISGWLWVGIPDGRSLFVAPFHDRTGGGPVIADHHWPGSGRMRLRARSSGLWMVLYSERGLRALNLLGQDDPRRDGPGWLDLWQARPGETLVSEPAFVRGADRGPERSAAWVTSGPAGLTLWLTPLPMQAGQRLQRRHWRLDTPGLVPPLAPGENRVALVEAPGGDGDRLLLATPQGLWLLELPDEPAPDEAPPKVLRLLGNRAVVLNGADAPGLVFLPEDGTGAGEDVCGTAFVACRDGRAPAREVLQSVTFSPRRRLHEAAYRDHDGVPLGLVPVRGRPQVLCRSGGTLVVSDRVGNQSHTLSYDSLTGAQWVRGYGRLVACAGIASGEGPLRWFTLLHDLDEENSLVDHAVSATLGSPPVLLGRHLFTIEPLTRSGRTALWVTRRRLVFEAAAEQM